jgi:hypothetical protein
VGVYWLIVNPAKREYLNPDRFGSGSKWVNLLTGTHCIALKCLLRDDGGVGHWVGDPVILAADETGRPNTAGLLTDTTENPNRNLYFQAKEEFIDISYRELGFLTRGQETADELVEQAKFDAGFLLDLYAVLEQYGPVQLQIALEREFGQPWRKVYHQKITECPYWTPLPRVEQV